MATDEVLLNSVQKGSPPILRLYEWKPATISIGYFQAVKKTVDLDKCNKSGMKLVRRITGGRAVLHNEELTYSFCSSSKDFPELGTNISETYQKISMALLCFLRLLEIEAEWAKPSQGKKSKNPSNSVMESSGTLQPAPTYNLPCFSSFSRYEISFQGRKLIGSAQRRFGDFFLQHGSILLKNGGLKLVDFLPLNPYTKGIEQELNSITIEEIKGYKLEPLQFIQSLKEGFSNFFQKVFTDDLLTSEELKEVTRLREAKYLKESWNFKY